MYSRTEHVRIFDIASFISQIINFIFQSIKKERKCFISQFTQTDVSYSDSEIGKLKQEIELLKSKLQQTTEKLDQTTVKLEDTTNELKDSAFKIYLRKCS